MREDPAGSAMTKNSVFRVGERIRVYGFDPDDVTVVRTRKILEIADDGIIRTDADEFVHPKQVRRLVPRKRREWQGQWMHITLYSEEQIIAFVPDDKLKVTSGMIDKEMTLREVRKP